MKLSPHSLEQIDDTYVDSLPEGKVRHLTKELLSDVKELHDRLNQNSRNSSRPPSSDAPWDTNSSKNDESATDESQKNGDDIKENPLSDDTETESQKKEQGEEEQNKQENDNVTENNSNSDIETKPKSPGRQKGSPGYGRTWKPPVNEVIEHHAECCAACGHVFDDSASSPAYTAYDSVEIHYGVPGKLGIEVIVTRHRFHETECSCGHHTRAIPYRAKADSSFDEIELSEWRLIGPNFASYIVNLNKRGRLSIRRIQEFLRETLGIPLSVGVLHKCIDESAALVQPLEKLLLDELVKATLIHIDETSWREALEKLWLWTFTSSLVVIYFIGRRTKAMVKQALGELFKGWLMSDGYCAYRYYERRLRCWAHLYRKAIGLSESLDQTSRVFGAEILAIMKELQYHIEKWRKEGYPHEKTMLIFDQFETKLDEFKALCKNELYFNSPYEKTRALAREFLNDWDAIFRVVYHPYLPLTNNEAERSLRHWVISRRIGYGTRTPRGSRGFALLASVIDTCRKRGASPWKYLGDVIRAARSGKPLPALPEVAGEISL